MITRALRAAIGFTGREPLCGLALRRSWRWAPQAVGGCLGLACLCVCAIPLGREWSWVLVMPLVPLSAAAAAVALVFRLRRTGVWDELLLTGLRPSDALVAGLVPALRVAGAASVVLATGWCWILPGELAQTVDGPYWLGAGLVLAALAGVSSALPAGIIGVWAGFSWSSWPRAVVGAGIMWGMTAVTAYLFCLPLLWMAFDGEPGWIALFLFWPLVVGTSLLAAAVLQHQASDFIRQVPDA